MCTAPKPAPSSPWRREGGAFRAIVAGAARALTPALSRRERGKWRSLSQREREKWRSLSRRERPALETLSLWERVRAEVSG
jgi:hypothetical protein